MIVNVLNHCLSSHIYLMFIMFFTICPMSSPVQPYLFNVVMKSCLRRGLCFCIISFPSTSALTLPYFKSYMIQFCHLCKVFRFLEQISAYFIVLVFFCLFLLYGFLSLYLFYKIIVFFHLAFINEIFIVLKYK